MVGPTSPRTIRRTQHTPPPTLQGFCAGAHRFTLKFWWVVGGVGVGGTNQHAPSGAPSIPLTYQLIPIYPYPPSHHARFLRRRASLNNGIDPMTIAGIQ